MDVTPEELLSQIRAGRAPVILDVRSEPEFRSGHVQGALHMPFWSALLRAGRLTARPDDLVVVYCGHGPRASLAAEALRLRGFRNVRLLEGHMAQWHRKGLPLEK